MIKESKGIFLVENIELHLKQTTEESKQLADLFYQQSPKINDRS